jgi:hypothetical protein
MALRVIAAAMRPKCDHRAGFAYYPSPFLVLSGLALALALLPHSPTALVLGPGLLWT